jgi:uncharacterized integral membrane protein
MKFRERFSTLNILITLIVLLILNIVLVMFNETILHQNYKLIGVSEKSELLKILGITLAGFLLMIQANIANRRVIGTEKGLEQERLKNAIEHLGDEKTSIRIGGLFELYRLGYDSVARKNQRFFRVGIRRRVNIQKFRYVRNYAMDYSLC